VFDLLRKKISSFIGDVSSREEEQLNVSISMESRLKGALLGGIEIREKDVAATLDELEFALLEADASSEVARDIVDSIRSSLVGSRVGTGEVRAAVLKAVREALKGQFVGRDADLLKLCEAKADKPFKMLFIGPNGAGKTTTIAKIAELFLKNGKTVLLCAGDSYRAAAIEQTEVHAERLGLKVIKHEYGADPAAVCFDAVNHARAHGIDVVLMDTAGRQDTNKNLMDELRKINRVAKPDFKVFIGESIAGNAIVDQVRSFKEAVGIDGVVLTKLDCDAKGGTVLSIAKAAGVPVLYFGIGQGYADIMKFDEDFVVSLILGNGAPS
jgi:fused signal recognition particle receptor